MNLITKIVAKYLILLPLAAVVYVFLKQKRNNKIEMICIGVIGGLTSLLFAKLSGHFYYDTRPFIANPHLITLIKGSSDNGFPSDHTMLSSFVAFLVLKYNRSLGLVMLVLAVLIGLARVHAGVHHLNDVVGGVLIAALGAAIGVAASKMLSDRMQKLKIHVT